MSLVTEDISLSNAAEWDAFLYSQSFHNAFQSGALMLALKDNPFYRPIGRLFRNGINGEIIGGYVAHIIQEIRGLGSIIGTRAIINGGPVVRKGAEEIMTKILEDATHNRELRGVYLEIWHGIDRTAFSNLFKKVGFAYSEHLNYLIDLSQGKETLFQQISKRKRQYIRKNTKLLKIRHVKSEDDFSAFYTQLVQTYRRVKVPLIEKNIFREIQRAGIGWFLLAEHENEVVACRAVLNFGKNLYDWYAGSSPLHSEMHANDSLVWWVLEQGAEQGYTRFDFGGAGKPDNPYGPREYKAKFGGKLVNYGRHRIILSPVRYLMLNAALKYREWLINLKQ
ncbi:MAG: GNAT family N-acetyltransferase [Deltaproteobacteria bacterium]|nr:GNAT family N-acetyltransferase [Deltaproteobacteria bacterium]